MSAFAERLREILTALSGVCAPPSPAALSRMATHASLLQKWNKTHNLTSLTRADEIAELLFADAWIVNAVLPRDERPIVDVGAGGGFPGLVLLAETPARRAVLFEKVGKKRSFLQVASAEMGLSGVAIRDVFPPPAGSIDVPAPAVYISRATFAPAEWLALAARECRAGDGVVTQCGREPLPPAPPGFRREASCEATLPRSGAARRLSYDVKSEDVKSEGGAG